jgi:hypothetical protein
MNSDLFGYKWWKVFHRNRQGRQEKFVGDYREWACSSILALLAVLGELGAQTAHDRETAGLPIINNFIVISTWVIYRHAIHHPTIEEEPIKMNKVNPFPYFIDWLSVPICAICEICVTGTAQRSSACLLSERLLKQAFKSKHYDYIDKTSMQLYKKDRHYPYWIIALNYGTACKTLRPRKDYSVLIVGIICR